MEIYILRHGEAEERETGLADRDRKLTAKGKRDLKAVLKVARKLRLRPDLILTSPLRRAQETAAIAAEVLGCKNVVETRNLLPGASPEQVWKEIGTDYKVDKHPARGPSAAPGKPDRPAAGGRHDGGS